MQMRQSRVLKKLRSGQVASCVKINLADPRVAEIAAMCGFDCIWIDMEHVPTDWATVENQIRSARIHGCDTMVRVARGSYSSHIQPLEADASGIDSVAVGSPAKVILKYDSESDKWIAC